jgi:hypothetical protein
MSSFIRGLRCVPPAALYSAVGVARCHNEGAERMGSQNPAAKGSTWKTPFVGEGIFIGLPEAAILGRITDKVAGFFQKEPVEQEATTQPKIDVESALAAAKKGPVEADEEKPSLPVKNLIPASVEISTSSEGETPLAHDKATSIGSEPVELEREKPLETAKKTPSSAQIPMGVDPTNPRELTALAKKYLALEELDKKTRGNLIQGKDSQVSLNQKVDRLTVAIEAYKDETLNLSKKTEENLGLLGNDKAQEKLKLLKEALLEVKNAKDSLLLDLPKESQSILEGVIFDVERTVKRGEACGVLYSALARLTQALSLAEKAVKIGEKQMSGTWGSVGWVATGASAVRELDEAIRSVNEARNSPFLKVGDETGALSIDEWELASNEVKAADERWRALNRTVDEITQKQNANFSGNVLAVGTGVTAVALAALAISPAAILPPLGAGIGVVAQKVTDFNVFLTGPAGAVPPGPGWEGATVRLGLFGTAAVAGAATYFLGRK